MLVCEATVLSCSLLALRWGMAADGGQGGYEDMALYSVMCSVSTFCAFMVTVAMVFVPEQVCALTACHLTVWCWCKILRSCLMKMTR